MCVAKLFFFKNLERLVLTHVCDGKSNLLFTKSAYGAIQEIILGFASYCYNMLQPLDQTAPLHSNALILLALFSVTVV